jgi:hypothetical protein
MRKLLLGLLATIVIAVPVTLAAPAANADAGSPKCMTKAEWRKIKDGMTRAKVKQITGIRGKFTNRTDYSDGTASIDVDYKQCRANGSPAPGSWNTVWISYDNYRYNYDYDVVFTGMQVDYKGSWSTPLVF